MIYGDSLSHVGVNLFKKYTPFLKNNLNSIFEISQLKGGVKKRASIIPIIGG